MAANYEMTFKDYLSILRRRRRHMAFAFALIFLATATVAMVLPPTYRSTGTILVESQQIPDDFIRSTVTSYADERIAIIKQRVLTRGNLLKIIQKYDMYRGRWNTLLDSEQFDRMRERVSLELIGAEQAKGGKTTIAFRLSFDDENADTSYRVANELVTLFLEENVKTRTARAAETTEFLSQEAKRLKADLETVETAIANYKQQYGNALPENMQMHMNLLERVEAEIQELDREYKSLQGERRFLDIQLTATRAGLDNAPAAGSAELSPALQLSKLKTEHARLSGIYREDHPDLLALRRQIDSLSEASGESGAQDAKLAELKTQHARLSGVYREDHPDLLALKRQIEALETENAAGARKGKLSVSADPAQARDFAIAKVEAAIASADARLASLEQQKKTLLAKRAELDRLIVQTPQVERGMFSLMRDYESAKSKYEEVRDKEMSALLSENLEEEKKAERFSLIEPPMPPDKTIKPNRGKLVVMGFFLALAGSGGLAMALESLQPRVRGARALAALAGTPPLVSIPYITTRQELLGRRDPKKLKIAAAAAVLILAAALLAVHFFYKPLDMLIYKILGRIE